MSDDLVERVAREFCTVDGTDPCEVVCGLCLHRAAPVVALCMEEAANPAFLRPLVEEQAKGEWDDKTIDEDVAMFAAAIRALVKEPQQ